MYSFWPVVDLVKVMSRVQAIHTRLLCQSEMENLWFTSLMFLPHGAKKQNKKILSRLQKANKHMLTFQYFTLWDGVKKAKNQKDVNAPGPFPTNWQETKTVFQAPLDR